MSKLRSILKIQEKTKKVLATIVKAIIVLVVFLVLYIPIFVIGLQSLNDSKTVYNFGGLTLRWYIALFNKGSPDYAPQLIQIISNTLIVTVIATIVSTVLGTFIAIGINSYTTKKRQKSLC